MVDKMQSRIEALSRITTKNGATSNEAATAQRKMKLYKDMERRSSEFTQRISMKEGTSNPTEVVVHPRDELNSQDVQDKIAFEQLKEANRKRWTK